jgi:hypothetical protein
LATGWDYWRETVYVNTDIRAHLLDLTASGRNVDLHFAFVSAGNRQGLISQMHVTFPVSVGSLRGEFFPAEHAFSVEGVPVVLHPGDLKLVSVSGSLPIQSMFEGGEVASPSDSEAGRGDSREVPLVLRIRALDFRGGKFQGRWEVCRVYVGRENVTGWSRSSEMFHVFDSVFRTDNNTNWISVEAMGKGSVTPRELK